MGHKGKDIAALWGVGRLPGAPGTCGSAAALAPGCALLYLGGPWALAGAALLLALVALWAAGAHAATTGEEDAAEVVIDEAVGMWLALLPAAGPLSALAAFALFRALDIAKPWPVSWAERRLPGAWGVVADDALAGAIAALLLWGAQRVFGF